MHWPDLAAVQQVAVESTMDYTGWRLEVSQHYHLCV